jgi:hypothetical protein
MKKINLKESLLRIDRDTDFKHALTDLYEACRLEEGDKRKLAQFIEDRDIPGMSNLLSNAAGVMTENISDDLPDDKAALVENDTMSMYRVANLEDIDYIMSYEMPDCIVYGGDVEGEYKCAYHNGVSVNVKFNPDAPGYVYTIDGEGPYETRSSETVKSDITRALDRKGWNEAFPNGSPTDRMTVSGDEPLMEEVNAQSLQSSVYQAATDKLRDMGYDEDFISDYFGVKVTNADNNCVRVTVWGELSYEETSELADILNPIVEKEDPQAYFDHDTSGRMSAYIRNDQSDDIPNEEQVAEWTDKFNNCRTWEELKVVYNEIVDSLNRDDLSGGTYSAVQDVIDRKIDELKPFEESLSEDTGFDDLDEGIFSIAGDAAGRGLVDLYKGVRNVAKGVRDVAKAGANDAKKMATDIKQSQFADKVRDVHRAVKNSDTVDDFKKDYKRRQDMRQKSDTKRDQVWKDEKGNERIGKSIGNKQDWVYVVDGKRMSYDEYKKIPSETRAKLSSEGKIQKFDLSGNHVTTNQNKKRLNAKDKVPNNKAPNNNVPNNNAPNNNAPNNAPNTSPKNNVPNNKATNNKASNNNVPNNNVPNNAPKKVVPKKVVPKNKVPKNGVKESLLMEGPGAGYTIECDIVIDGFNGTPSIKRIELDKDPGATPGSYKVYLDCDGTGHVEGLEAHSYYYGDSFPGTYPIKISELLVSVSVVGEGDIRDAVEESMDDILSDLVGNTFTSKYVYGGGWSHSTYDGTLTDTTNPLNDTCWGEDDNISYEVYGMDARLTDSDIIEEIDIAVTGENEDSDFEESLNESDSIISDGFSSLEAKVQSLLDKYGFTEDRYQNIVTSRGVPGGAIVTVSFTDGITASDYKIIRSRVAEAFGNSVYTYLGKRHLNYSKDNELWSYIDIEFPSEYFDRFNKRKTNESKFVKESYTHFTYKSGANPYIAKTDAEVNKLLKKYGNKAKKVKDGYYEIDDCDSGKDMFAVDDSLTERYAVHPEEDKISKRLMSIPGTTKVEFDWDNAEVYRIPENHLIMLVFCGDGFDEPYFENRRRWRASVLGKLRSMGWTLEDPVEDNDSYLYLVMKKRKAVEEAFVHPQFSGPWWYLCKHGIGPGALPKGVNVVDTVDDEENPNRCYVALDKVLTTNELKQYEMTEKKPPRMMSEASNKVSGNYSGIKGLSKNLTENSNDPKSWPDDKELTYDEAMKLALAYYSQGGDGFYETTEKYQFDDMVDMFGPMTVRQLKSQFRTFDDVAKDMMSEDTMRSNQNSLMEDDSPQFMRFELVPDNRKWQYSVGGIDVPYTSYEDAVAHIKDDYNIGDYRKELQQYLKSEGFDYFVDETFDGRLCIEIHWGDWKHEHRRADYLVRQFFMDKGLGVHVDEQVTEEDGSDCYSAEHYYSINDLYFSGRVVK